MDNYINQFESFDNVLIYNFQLGYGGIGDCICFFMVILESCMKNNTRLYYKRNNLEIERYISLKYDKMYIQENMIPLFGYDKIVDPFMYYTTVKRDYSININEVFYFTDEVISNRKQLFNSDITNYISIHLRLGDKYLETDPRYVVCKEDTRSFSEESLYKCIEENSHKTIFFCCDNKGYKLKLKEKYNTIHITNCDIGHTSLLNTSKNQVLDAITEFYILTQSEMIYSVASSGFSTIASKFNGIPLHSLHSSTV